MVLIRDGKDKALQLKDARFGRKLAENTVKRFPQNGVARYLVAYLTALEAKYDPLNGLDLVPIVEREALIAAQLDPKVDHGGPDRMLGVLFSHRHSVLRRTNLIIEIKPKIIRDPADLYLDAQGNKITDTEAAEGSK